MKIAVNTRFLIKDKLEGLGLFTLEVLKRMVKNHPEHQFVFLFDRPFDPSFILGENVEGLVVSPQARHPILWKWWFERSLPKVFKKINADIFFSPDSYLSLKSAIPTLLVVHDLAFEHHPEDVGKSVRNYYQKYTPKFCQRAERIVTVSEFTKKDIVKHYGTEDEKIDVAPNGVRTKFYPIDDDLKVDVKNKWTQGRPYLVYVGSIHPRKNLSRLFEAFDELKTYTDCNWKLVVVGRKAWQAKAIFDTYQKMQFKDDVVFTGRISDHDMNNVMAGAEAMCYVPYFEGFGLPILEAQQCGIPVMTSNTSSMPEVAGDACLLVDPFSVDDIFHGLKRLYNFPKVRKELIEKGNSNKERFNWDITEAKIWDSLMKVANA